MSILHALLISVAKHLEFDRRQAYAFLMSMKTVTFEAPEESIAMIDEIAVNLEADRASVLREALATYLADYQELKADIQEAERQLDAGESSSHEEVVARHRMRVQAAKAA